MASRDAWEPTSTWCVDPGHPKAGRRPSFNGRRGDAGPDPCRANPDKLKALAEAHGISRFTTDLDSALADPSNSIYFDSQTTDRRAGGVRKAIAARKAIYCEKPTAVDTATAIALYNECKAAGLKNGVVQDKLWLPGLLKLKLLIDSGFFGRILSVRG
jgi:predicted dehydrogenase